MILNVPEDIGKKIHQIILYKFLVTILQTYNNNILST